MRASFAILALTALLLMFGALVLGFVISDQAGEARIASEAKHVVLGIVAVLFTCFVHVLAFTYFVVCARMARDAVDVGRLSRQQLGAISALKRRAIRHVMLANGPLLLTAVLGALSAPPALVAPTWHAAAAFLAVCANGAAFLAEYGLIRINVALTDEFYSAGAPEGIARRPGGGAA